MNDERPIEKLLRRFAKKRRDEASAPAELHPANRRALQAEVARQYPKAQPRVGWWAGLSLLLNRKLAYAVAVVAVIAVAVALLPTTKQGEPMGLAALDEKRDTEKQLSPARPTEEISATAKMAREAKDSFAAEPPAAPPAVRTESVSIAADSTSGVGGINSVAPQSAPLTLTPTSRTRSVPTSNVEADRAAVRRQQVAESVARYNEQSVSREPARSDALSAPAPAERAPLASVPKPATVGSIATNAESGGVFSGRYGVGPTPTATGSAQPASAVTAVGAKAEVARSVQSFLQIPVNGQVTSGRQAGRVTPVLANFTVEQTGDQIRVTDSDGSTYTGLVQFVAQENVAQMEFIARGGGLEKSRQSQTSYNAVATDAGLGGDLNNQNYFFKVSGTNRTLKQQVNFIGNFLALSNQAVNAYDAAQFADKAKNSQNQWNVAPLLNNSAIQGQLQIGTSREMKLNAVPVQK